MKSVEDQLSQKYQLIDRLGSGAFGHLILVRSKNNQQLYACKIQKNHGKKTILIQKQFKMMVDLMDTKRFPEVYAYKVLQQNSYMIMEKLQENLDSYFKKNQKSFHIKTIALIANEAFTSLQILHSNSILHRDLKPQNMMTCPNSHRIKLIDFGLAERIFAKQSVALIGNVRFCSRRAHFGYSGKKQDLQSLLFVIYYFLVAQLPWQSATEQDIQKQIDRNVREAQEEKTFILGQKQNFLDVIKYPETTNSLKMVFYQELHELARYILTLSLQAKIDYKLINHKTQRLMAIAGIRKGECYEWCKPPCPHAISFKDYWQVIP